MSINLPDDARLLEARLSSESARSCPRSHLASVESRKLSFGDSFCDHSVACEVDFPSFGLVG